MYVITQIPENSNPNRYNSLRTYYVGLATSEKNAIQTLKDNYDTVELYREDSLAGELKNGKVYRCTGKYFSETLVLYFVISRHDPKDLI